MQDSSSLRQCNLPKHLLELQSKAPCQIIELRVFRRRRIATPTRRRRLLLKQFPERVVE